MNDSLGDRMKLYEQAEAGRKGMLGLAIMVRLDGKGFSKYTKDMERPYDKRLSDLMVETTAYLVEEIDGCKAGYTQSDEMTLLIYSDNPETQVYFDGKFQKLASVIASMATAFFNARSEFYLPPTEKPASYLNGAMVRNRPFAIFDCRVWNVPSKEEAANAFLWRELDASKNSISMAARTFFSHKELQDVSGAGMQEMMFAEKGVNWNDYPAFFKRGTFVQRATKLRELTPAELSAIPEKYRPKGPVERSSVERIDMPKFSTVINRVEVLFDGAVPKIETATGIITFDTYIQMEKFLNDSRVSKMKLLPSDGALLVVYECPRSEMANLFVVAAGQQGIVKDSYSPPGPEKSSPTTGCAIPPEPSLEPTAEVFDGTEPV